MRRFGRLGLVCVIALAACSSGSSSSSSTTTTSPAALVPSGTPVGSLSLSGDAGLTGPATGVSIRCGFPDLQGPSIAILATAYDASTSLRIGIRAAKVTVRLFSTATDGQYHERAFEGTAVTDFDAAKGAKIESNLSEVKATASSTPGALGAITAIKASIECNAQKPGTSSLTLTGETAEGSLSAAKLDSVRVECNQDALGNEVVVLGILTIGSTKAFVSVGLRVDGLELIETFEAFDAQRRYQAPAGAASPTATGGHANGDVVEQNATPSHTLHVEGDVVCGSPT
ncbi:MAG: hypothetical protein QOI95_3960 [Acidimicrobiaceae bacterium]|jgi:hypothetical protein